ncbi:MAG: hypothetical protein HQL24_09885 [Candidatus Omnitrophica bacterium]|nr:hypothetical protein [Candidatus Omnitrophota bacterium]
MLIYIIIGLAGICFFVGLILILKEYRTSKIDEASAVPVSTLNDVEEPKVVHEVPVTDVQLSKETAEPEPQAVHPADAVFESSPIEIKPEEIIPPVEIKQEVAPLLKEEVEPIEPVFEKEIPAEDKILLDVQLKIDALIQENQSLKDHLDEQSREIADLQQANAQLREQNKEAGEMISTKMPQQASALVDKIVDLQKKNDELLLQLKEAMELSTQFTEKENSLKLELTKYRAQSLGLERICEDLKLQNEEMSKAIKAQK